MQTSFNIEIYLCTSYEVTGMLVRLAKRLTIDDDDFSMFSFRAARPDPLPPLASPVLVVTSAWGRVR